MDALFELVAPLILHWRVGLPTFVALGVAIFLAATVSWFMGWYGILLILSAFGGGMFWEAHSSKR